MLCRNCKFWGDGSGRGESYDAGHVNDCNHPLVSGNHHQSSSSYRDDEISKVIVPTSDQPQLVVTRHNFGCVLFVSNGK